MVGTLGSKISRSWIQTNLFRTNQKTRLWWIFWYFCQPNSTKRSVNQFLLYQRKLLEKTQLLLDISVVNLWSDLKKCKEILRKLNFYKNDKASKNEKILIGTIFAIITLNQKFADKINEWKLLVEKAFDYCSDFLDRESLEQEMSILFWLWKFVICKAEVLYNPSTAKKVSLWTRLHLFVMCKKKVSSLWWNFNFFCFVLLQSRSTYENGIKFF